MSGNKGSSSSQSQQQSQSYLDPQIVSTLEGNYGQAKQLAGSTTYQPLTGQGVNSYFSPFVGQAVNATEAAINNQTQQQIAQNGVAAAASGDYDSTGRNVQNALTNQLAGQTLASTTSNLENEGYQEATQTAQTENTAKNQFPIVLQQLVNQSLGLVGNPVLSASSGSSSGSSSSFGFSLPAPTPGG